MSLLGNRILRVPPHLRFPLDQKRANLKTMRSQRPHPRQKLIAALIFAMVGSLSAWTAEAKPRQPAKKRVAASSTKNAVKRGLEAPKAATSKPLAPRQFVDERVTRILRDMKGRAPRPQVSGMINVGAPILTSKNQWLQTVYSQRLVDASTATGWLSDKLLFFETARREIGDVQAAKFLVQTVGLRDFLMAEGLLAADGRLAADGDRIESTLFKKFQSGFVARPAVGVAPRETGRGLFKTTDDFVAELLKTDSFLYRPEHSKKPVRSTVLDQIASGEAIVLQEDLIAIAENAVTTSQTKGTARPKFTWREVRVHTYEGRVVPDAVPNFWVREKPASREETAAAQKFVADFLSLLPPTLLSRQAWSFDVLLLGPGDMRIVDLITNRGRKVAWSGYLDQPRVIGAYTRHFERYAGLHFTGVGGMLLRKNVGNYFAYWGLRIQKSRPGFEKVLAYIPPWP